MFLTEPTDNNDNEEGLMVDKYLLIKKCGEGRIRYEIFAEVLNSILNSLSNLFSILVCNHALLYKRGVNK